MATSSDDDSDECDQVLREKRNVRAASPEGESLCFPLNDYVYQPISERLEQKKKKTEEYEQVSSIGMKS